MKKSLFLLLFLAFAVSPVVEAGVSQNEYLIIEDINTLLTVIPNDYMQAESVKVELFDAGNALIARSSGAPGVPMQFELGDSEQTPHRIRLTYYMAGGSDYVVIDDILE